MNTIEFSRLWGRVEWKKELVRVSSGKESLFGLMDHLLPPLFSDSSMLLCVLLWVLLFGARSWRGTQCLLWVVIMLFGVWCCLRGALHGPCAAGLVDELEDRDRMWLVSVPDVWGGEDAVIRPRKHVKGL